MRLLWKGGQHIVDQQGSKCGGFCVLSLKTFVDKNSNLIALFVIHPTAILAMATSLQITAAWPTRLRPILTDAVAPRQSLRMSQTATHQTACSMAGVQFS